jgi:hypothetical protein
MIQTNEIPQPTVMPIDRENWVKQLNLCNFVNSFYQYRDLCGLENCKNVLIVGPGQGLDKVILSWRGYTVTTLDIDPLFQPDHLGSIHDMSMFTDRQFDAVIVSHVLEHMAETYLNPGLKEISRVGRFALIYLPVHGRSLHLRFIPGFKGIDVSLVWDVFNYFKKCDGKSAKYCGGQHFWEIGLRGFRVKDLVNRFSQFFDVLSVYRNYDWLPSQNFVLRSK